MPPVHVTTPASEHSATSATIISVSIAVTITIIVFFILGFVCSCFCQKYKQTFCKTSVVRSSTGTDSKVKDQESHDLEMTENVAYGPLDI